ncbi:MAG: glutaredoxin [Candidatus Magasanikbacteria bacterium]|nr:glutaredoxin [Candidatus Magasanikbacteria bacterium]
MSVVFLSFFGMLVVSIIYIFIFMKRYFYLLFCAFGFLGLFFVPPFVFAEEAVEVPQDNEVLISVFVRDDCAHCIDEKAFLAEFVKDHPEVVLDYRNLDDETQQQLFSDVAQKHSLIKGTPITMVQNTLIQGFGTAETTGELIRSLVERADGVNLRFEEALTSDNVEVSSGFVLDGLCTEESCEVESSSYLITLPIIRKTVDVGSLSLATLSLVLGLVDGFNPCALWVLIMFLLILSQLKSRKRMLQYAGLFILAEAVMYYLILNVWFTAWDFISLNNIVTPLVGLLALGSGIYFFYKFLTYTPTCSVASLDQQQKMTDKVKSLASKPMTIGVVLGILGLAFSVNIFEFACSIGIPQTFTKILELNGFTWLTRQWYMFLYILMYMVDDVIVFGIALYSINKIGVVHKYSKWSTLLGAILMLLLGAIMLFRPELLIL